MFSVGVCIYVYIITDTMYHIYRVVIAIIMIIIMFHLRYNNEEKKTYETSLT